MAPPKTYMIPLQFPAGLYDYAKPPGPFAHWTSDPAYSYEEFARSNPRPERKNRSDRKGRAKRNGGGGMPHPYDVPENAGPFWPDAYPYGAKGRPMAYGPTARELAAAKGNPETVDPAWKAAAERLLEKRKGKSIDDFTYRAYLRAILQGAMPVTHKDGIPYIGALEARQDLIDEYGKGPSRKNPRSSRNGRRAMANPLLSSQKEIQTMRMIWDLGGSGVLNKDLEASGVDMNVVSDLTRRGLLHRKKTRLPSRFGTENWSITEDGLTAMRNAKMSMALPNRSKRKSRKNGPTLDQPHYPFAAMEKRYASYSDADLHYALLDAREAAKHEDAMAKGGHGLSRYGWYADDVHTINAEINKRKRRK